MATMAKRLDTIIKKIAFVSIFLMVFVVGYTMLFFAFGIPMTAYNAVVPVVAIAIYGLIKDRDILFALIVNFLLLVIWAFICSKIFDWSYDGMYYHKEAIITLAKEWNPLYESCRAAEPLNANADLTLWLDNYPKGLWICSAAIYIITDFLETAKAVNILFIILVFNTALSTFKTVLGAGVKTSVLFALLCCLNPVFADQVFTSYNDLAVGSLIITAAFLGMKIYSEKADLWDYATLFLTAAMSCLVKFTAPLLVGIVLIAYGIGYAIKSHGINQRFKQSASIILAGFIIGSALLGFDPYIKHLINGQNLVYPVMGEDRYDIMNTNPPKDFEGKAGISEYFMSLASKTMNDSSKDYEAKLPFTIHKSELEYLSNADIRLGGFGVWFSGIFLLSVIASALAAVISRRKIQPEPAIAILVFLALGLFFPESWWARYASYTYYIPVFLLFYAVDRTRVRGIAFIISFAVIINSVITLRFVVHDGRAMTGYFNQMLDEIEAENKKIELRINDFPSHIKMFEEKGITYEISKGALSDAIVFHADTKYKFIEDNAE